MANVKVCDKCNTVIDETTATMGDLVQDRDLSTLTIQMKTSQDGDLCPKCIRKEYYHAAKQAFQGLMSTNKGRASKSKKGSAKMAEVPQDI